MDVTQGLEIGKMQIDGLRTQMELEHYQLGEMIQMELEEVGYPCELKEDGSQRFSGIKVKKWIIVSTDPKVNTLKFRKEKDKMTKKWSKIRMKELKDIKKQEKRKKKT